MQDKQEVKGDSGRLQATTTSMITSVCVICVQGTGVGGQGDKLSVPVSSEELLYYNSITSLPLLCFLTLVDGSVQALPSAYAMVSADRGAI